MQGAGSPSVKMGLKRRKDIPGKEAKHGAWQIMAHSGTRKQLGMLGSRMSSAGRPHKRGKQLSRQTLAAKHIMYQAAGSLGGSGKGVA